MPTLRECMGLIAKLADEKEWGEDPATKIYYAMIELGEAGDIWKHRGDQKYLNKLGITNIYDAISEELIDTIFYCLHCIHCLKQGFNPDDIFLMKFTKNRLRNRIYVDDNRASLLEANKK